MAEDNNKVPVKGTQESTYITPQGVFEGTPDIAYSFTPGFTPKEPVPVGGVILADEPIEYNKNRKTKTIVVKNTGDRAVQIGSHFHFFEVNRYVEFDRAEAFGYRLDIPATTAIRLEPGDMRSVNLVSYGGKRRIIGFNGLVDGFTGQEDFPTYYPKFIESMRKVDEYGFKTISEADAEADLSKNKQTKK